MNLLSNLQFSIHSVFGLYKEQGRKYYSLSVIVGIFAALTGITLTFCIYYIYKKLVGGNELFHSFDPTGIMGQSPLIAIPVALSLALFAIVIHRNMDNQEYKPSMNGFFRSVGGKNIGRFFLLSVGGIILCIVLRYLQTLHTSNTDGSMEELLNLFSSSDSGIVRWIKSLLDLPILLLPYILSFVFMNLHMRDERVVPEKLKNTFWSFLLLFFIFDVCQGQLFVLLNKHVLSLFQLLPFTEMWIPVILFIAVLIFFFGIFAMPLASGMIFPFLFDSKIGKKPEVIESNDLLDR